MKFSYLILLLLIISIFGIGQAVYKLDPNTDIYNITNKLNWNSSNFDLETEYYNYSEYDPAQIDNIRVRNIILKFIDCVGFTMFEGVKFGVEWGFNHPEVDYIYLMTLLKYLIIFSIVAALIPVILPVCAIIYLLYVGVKRGVLKIKGLFIKKEG